MASGVSPEPGPCVGCDEVGVEQEAETQCETCDRLLCWTCCPGYQCPTCRKKSEAAALAAFEDHCEQLGDEYRNGER